jgi:RNA polymerase sigma-70 factor (ECF subfamily)
LITDNEPVKPTLTDLELLDAWRRGRESAGNELLERHFHIVYRFFARKLDGVVDDLVQKTFVACVERRDQIRDGATFRAFLIGVARYELLTELRRRGALDRRLKKVEDIPIAPPTSPSGIAAAREEQKVLLRALQKLSLDLQIAVEMHYWEQMTMSEIAQVLDVPSGTIKWRLAKAREQLREHICADSIARAVAESTLGGLDDWARSLREVVDE